MAYSVSTRTDTNLTGGSIMNRWARSAVLWLAPGVVLSLALLGCSGDKKDGKGGSPSKHDNGKPSDDKGGGSGDGDKLTMIKGEGATITGKVTLEGDKPDIAKLDADLLAAIKKNDNKDHCLKGSAGEKSQQEWII